MIRTDAGLVSSNSSAYHARLKEIENSKEKISMMHQLETMMNKIRELEERIVVLETKKTRVRGGAK